MHVLRFPVCFSRNMRGRSRAPFLPSVQVKTVMPGSCQSDAQNKYI